MKGTRLQTPKPPRAANVPEGVRRLGIGESITVTVPARAMWHDTRVCTRAGEEYQFSASGSWIDWYIPCDANGWVSIIPLKPLEAMRRMPDANWFALVGCIERDLKHTFLIGREARVKMSAGGELYCFANDAPWAYWNNLGSLKLKITRIK